MANDFPTVLTATELHVRYNEQVVLDHASLTVGAQDRIGLVGRNGSGKSTFLRILAGLQAPDAGEITQRRGLVLSYLAQEFALNRELNVADNIRAGARAVLDLIHEFEVLPAESSRHAELEERIATLDGWNLDNPIEVAMSHLNCPAGDRDVTTLSGGEQRRVALCRAIIARPDLLLLDEPTNHLDTESIEWLAEFLEHYPGAVLLVTHDRYCLERIANRIVELATACADAQPVLSKRLMWLWKNNGKVHSSFYSSSVLRVNEELPAEDPKLGNATFPGYYSVLRSAWNTPKETSAHCIMGDFYSDHRGDGSSGQVVLYALGAPLSVGWESMYSPHNPTPYTRNTIVPEASLPMAWNADLPDLGVPGDPWERKTQRQGTFASFSHSGSVKMHATSGADLNWTRHVLSIHPNDDYPLFLITDRFTGKKAGDPLIQNWSMMSSGAVATPDGDVTPGESVHPKMPSGGPVHPLKAGLSKFSFTGQSFGKAGITPAIDWDLYSVAPNDRQFCLGSWGHNSGGSLGGRDAFQAVNGKPYEQRQHLLHIMGAGGFTTLIVPRLKGAAAPAVTQEGGAFKVAMPGGTVLLYADGYTYVGADKAVATAFGAVAVAAEGLSVEGGPTEVAYDRKSRTITVTAHGPGGQRLIGVPAGRWEAQDKALAWDAAAKKWTLDYAGGKPGEAKPATAVLKQAKP